MTDSSGTKVWEADYQPFGKASITLSNIENNLRFPGQYYDAETGLHYNYYRYYDPETGRYITSDPIGLKGGLNTYAYVGGNPVNVVDPTGEVAQFIIPGLGLGILLEQGKIFSDNAAATAAAKRAQAAARNACVSNPTSSTCSCETMSGAYVDPLMSDTLHSGSDTSKMKIPKPKNYNPFRYFFDD